MPASTRRATLIAILAAMSGVAHAQPPPLSDVQLVRAVMKAAHDGVSPTLVEARVGRPATVNTTRSGDRAVLSVTSLGFDPSRPSQAKSLVAADLAYWRRPTATHDIQVVGIVWRKAGPPQYFFAIVAPQE